MNLLTQAVHLVCSVTVWPEIICQVACWAGSAVVAELVHELPNAPPLRQPGARPKNSTRGTPMSMYETPTGLGTSLEARLTSIRQTRPERHFLMGLCACQYPLSCQGLHPFEVLWPIVQDCRVKIGAIGPYQRMHLEFDAHLIE